MRVRTIGDQRVGLSQHEFGHVGVQVQAGDQRYVRPDQCAHASQHFAFAIVVVLGDHCPMKIEIHPIGRQRRGNVLQQDRHDALERITRYVRGRAGGAPQGGDQGVLVFARRVRKACRGNIGSLDSREDLLAARHARPASAQFEGVPICLAWCKRIRFVLKAANNNAHLALLCKWKNG
ncbi:hypothetical protein D3C71_1551400 [compost metagenome]